MWARVSGFGGENFETLDIRETRDRKEETEERERDVQGLKWIIVCFMYWFRRIKLTQQVKKKKTVPQKGKENPTFLGI